MKSIIYLVILCLFFGLLACEETSITPTNNSKLIGNWESQRIRKLYDEDSLVSITSGSTSGVHWEFREDNTGTYRDFEFTTVTDFIWQESEDFSDIFIRGDNYISLRYYYILSSTETYQHWRSTNELSITPDGDTLRQQIEWKLNKVQ
jgi:hypothetical protein